MGSTRWCVRASARLAAAPDPCAQTIGPPESGKSDVTSFCAKLLGPISASEDDATDAASRSQGGGQSNLDCRFVVHDEGNKVLHQNQALRQQTSDESGVCTIGKMVPIVNNGVSEGWEKSVQTVAMRQSRSATANAGTQSAAQLSRLATIVLPKIERGQNELRRNALPPSMEKAASDGLRDVVVAAVGAHAPLEHFGVANKRFDTMILQVFSQLLSDQGIKYGPRELRRVESFAIGVQASHPPGAMAQAPLTLPFSCCLSTST